VVEESGERATGGFAALWRRARQAGPTLVVGFLTGKAFWTLLDQGIVSAANFATTLIIGRTSAEQLGLYVLGFTIVIALVNAQSSIINFAYTVYSPRLEDDARARYTGSTLVHQGCYGALVITGLAVAGWAVPRDMTEEGLAPVLSALAGVILFLLLREYARQVSFARLRAKTALAVDCFIAAVQVGGLLLLAWYGRLTARTAWMVIGSGAGLAVLAWLFAHRRLFAIHLAHIVPDFRKNWSFSRWILAYSLAYLASTQLYPWILNFFHGKTETGIYGACTGVIFLANPFLLGMGNFLGPKTSHAYAEEGVAALRRVVNKATAFFAATMGVFCLIMFTAGPYLVMFLFGDAYAGQHWPIALLALAQLAWAFTIPANFGLNALERPDVSFKGLLLAVGVTLTLGVYLVYALGIVGVAAGMLAGNTAACLFTRAVFSRQMNRIEIGESAA